MEIFDTSEYLSIYHLRNILLFEFVIKDYGRGGENVFKLGSYFHRNNMGTARCSFITDRFLVLGNFNAHFY